MLAKLGFDFSGSVKKIEKLIAQYKENKDSYNLNEFVAKLLEDPDFRVNFKDKASNEGILHKLLYVFKFKQDEIERKFRSVESEDFNNENKLLITDISKSLTQVIAYIKENKIADKEIFKHDNRGCSPFMIFEKIKFGNDLKNYLRGNLLETAFGGNKFSINPLLSTNSEASLLGNMIDSGDLNFRTYQAYLEKTSFNENDFYPSFFNSKRSVLFSMVNRFALIHDENLSEDYFKVITDLLQKIPEEEKKYNHDYKLSFDPSKAFFYNNLFAYCILNRDINFEKQSLDINHKNVQILCKALLDCKADLKLSDKEFEDVVNYSKQRYGEGELLTLLNSHKEKRATYRYERPGAVVLDASIGIASMTLGDGARAK